MSFIHFGSNTPKSSSSSSLLYGGYNKTDFDLELGTIRRSKRPTKTSTRMVKAIVKRLQLHPLLLLFVLVSFGVTIIVILSIYVRGNYRGYEVSEGDLEDYPFAKLKNLVMVAGHSVYTSSSCGKADEEGSWFLETYQRHPGQAATFLEHIKQGVEVTARDNDALLLFSGGETRKDAGPRSEAQSYWMVAESKLWFGKIFFRTLLLFQ